jgi:hypothetical protein
MGQARSVYGALHPAPVNSHPSRSGLDCCVVMRLPPHRASRDIAMIDRCGATSSMHPRIYVLAYPRISTARNIIIPLVISRASFQTF